LAAALAAPLAAAVLAGVPAAPGAAGGRAVSAVTGAALGAGSWGRAIEVPGLGALNNGGHAEVLSMSCTSAGNCSAGGYYTDSHGWQGFVVTERNGHWGKAIGVPGLGALNTSGEAQVVSVSCASAGNCSAGGYYQDRRADNQGFVAVERNGRWGKAIEVPGLAALNRGAFPGGGAEVNSVSCGSAGNCSAGGYYSDRRANQQGFVAAERNGRWSKAIGVPGLAALNTGGSGAVDSVSCASAGNCTAGGNYLVSGGGRQGFVGAERDGAWRRAMKVPGLAALNTGGFVEVDTVSCASAGNCAIGGLYTDRHPGGFVAVERNGVWGTAIQVPGLAALNVGRISEVVSVSCASAGSCAAGGYYFDRSHHPRVFVASENDGVWDTAIQIPGLAALDKGDEDTRFPTVSCAPASTCAVGGYYTDRSGHAQGFVTQAG
jgi:hypothetical protein